MRGTKHCRYYHNSEQRHSIAISRGCVEVDIGVRWCHLLLFHLPRLPGCLLHCYYHQCAYYYYCLNAIETVDHNEVES